MIEPTAVERALSEVVGQIELQADYYPGSLPVDHPARLAGWRSHLYGSHKLTMPGAALRFSELAPLARQLEVNRSHAEALLVQEKLGQVILSIREREELVQRAIGLLPASESERFEEIHSCPALRPRQVAASARTLADALTEVESSFGAATALAYTQIIVAGLRARTEFTTYGRKLDTLFDRITSAPSVIQTLDRLSARGAGTGFEARFRVLVAVRERLWQLKPGRVAPDGFLLTKVLDAMLGARPSVGNALGLAVLDAIVLGRLGFPVRYQLASGVIRLEVIVEGRSVYWETTDPQPLSFVPIASGSRLEPGQLLCLTYSSLAASYFNRGLWDKAIENYRRVLEIDPGSSAACCSIGAGYLRKGWPQDAVKALDQALKLDPDNAEALHALGGAYAMLNQWPRAIDAYKKALRLQPGYVEALYNLGLAFRSSGEPTQAVAALEAALEVRPEYAEAHMALGNLHLETGRVDDSIRHYREAARIEPDSASAHYNLGRAHYEKGHLDQAIHAYERCLQVNPKHAAAWHNLGIAFRDRGQKARAVEALEKAVTLNPNLMR